MALRAIRCEWRSALCVPGASRCSATCPLCATAAQPPPPPHPNTRLQIAPAVAGMAPVPMQFSSLPDELLVEVLSKLTVAERWVLQRRS